ncbi:uncharacterized protein [Panulirus ornatus]|uniref:uncharacterized protein isoform X2 n=1 Tax=Panulirus ornatus TaxID=150431 RepID=UPI003A876D78
MFTKVSFPKMERRALVYFSLFVLGTNLIRGTSGTTDVSSVVTHTTDYTNASIDVVDPHATDGVAATNLTATDNTNLTEGTDDVVFVEYLEKCCWYDNAVCAGNNTFCSSCICRCQGNHSFNNVSMSCEAVGGQDDQVGGRLPGQPCTSASQCIEGLLCNSTICTCPWPCVYVEKHLVCDCGESMNPLTGPIVCGLVLGLLIVMFWCTRTYYTYDRFKEQNKVSRLPTSVSGISTLGAAYGTDHITMNPMRSQTHPLALPSCPRPHSQTVAPLSPSFRYQPPQVEAARPPGQNYQTPFAPPHRLATSTFSPSYQIFGSDNPAYDISSGPAGPPCPSSAPEDRRSVPNSVSKTSVPPTPDLTQPPRSARF